MENEQLKQAEDFSANVQSELMRISLRIRQIGNKSNIEPLLQYANDLSDLASKIKTDNIVYPKIVRSEGANWQRDNAWIDATKQTPDLIEGKDYSENVLAVINGHLGVACYCYIEGDDGGFVWANCYNDLDGDAEFDDEYDVTWWMPKPTPPQTIKSK